jgi:hypothetical protein
MFHIEIFVPSRSCWQTFPVGQGPQKAKRFTSLQRATRQILALAQLHGGPGGPGPGGRPQFRRVIDDTTLQVVAGYDQERQVL